MPELPEVEFARLCLERWAAGRQVLSVAASASARRVLRPGGPRALEALRGVTLERFERRGKNLLITVDALAGTVGLWSHLGMTGKWLRRPSPDEPPRFTRISLALDDGHTLHYADLRLFGRLQVVPGARWDQVRELEDLGPHPLVDGVDRRRLAERLAKLKVPIKVALLDQRLLPGVGNIQASEALHRARLDPRRPARSLTAAEVSRLATGVHRSILATLAKLERATTGDVAYVEEGAPNPFAVYGRAGERCPRRNGVITRIVQAGRSTFFCPGCVKAATSPRA